jgi:hypothetical protein
MEKQTTDLSTNVTTDVSANHEPEFDSHLQLNPAPDGNSPQDLVKNGLIRSKLHQDIHRVERALLELCTGAVSTDSVRMLGRLCGRPPAPSFRCGAPSFVSIGTWRGLYKRHGEVLRHGGIFQVIEMTNGFDAEDAAQAARDAIELMLEGVK